MLSLIVPLHDDDPTLDDEVRALAAWAARHASSRELLLVLDGPTAALEDRANRLLARFPEVRWVACAPLWDPLEAIRSGLAGGGNGAGRLHGDHGRSLSGNDRPGGRSLSGNDRPGDRSLSGNDRPGGRSLSGDDRPGGRSLSGDDRPGGRSLSGDDRPGGRGRGWSHALSLGLLSARGERLVVADGPVRDPEAQLSPLVAALDEGADLVLAREGRPRLSARLWNLASRCVLDRPRAAASPFRAFRSEAARAVVPRLDLTSPAVDLELLRRCETAGLVVTERLVPGPFRPRFTPRPAELPALAADLVRLTLRPLRGASRP